MTGRTAYEAFYAGLPKDTFEPWDEVRPDSQAIWARIERAVLADGERLRDALKEEAHWHDRKAKELGKQPPSIDRNWRMGVHRERRDAICPLVGWPEGGPAWGEMDGGEP